MNARTLNGLLMTDGQPLLADSRPQVDGKEPPARRTYRSPRVRCLGDAAGLLEVLGPAQANYGGFA